MFKNIILVLVVLSMMGCPFKAQKNTMTIQEGASFSIAQLPLKNQQELVSEMLRVTYNESAEQISPTEYRQWLGAFQQGASLEGVLRGILMSPKYQKLEAQSTPASKEMLRAFSELLSELQSRMKEPSVFTDQSKKPMQIDYPEGENVNSEKIKPSKNTSYTQTQAALKLSIEARARFYAQFFLGASPYTLKRILNEEIFKYLDEFKVLREEDPSDLEKLRRAQFYRSLVEQSLQHEGAWSKEVDLGSTQRNNHDLEFHFQWAKNAHVDRLTWEILNRYQRCLNSFLKTP